MSDNITQVRRLTWAIHKILAGKPPALQGAVLADLLATWIAGHAAQDDCGETAALREQLLAMHIQKVRELIPINAAIIHGSETAD